jgi:hypothetical protein
MYTREQILVAAEGRAKVFRATGKLDEAAFYDGVVNALYLAPAAPTANDETQPLDLAPIELGPRTLHALVTCHLAAQAELSPHNPTRAREQAEMHARHASMLIKASREAFEAEE